MYATICPATVVFLDHGERRHVELISVTRTPDGLKVFLTIRDELAANYPTFEELRNFLVGNGIIYGIDDAALQQMVRNKTCNFPTEVARGTPSIPATPGRLRWENCTFCSEPFAGEPHRLFRR